MKLDIKRSAAQEFLSKVASVKRLDPRHLEMTFASPEAREDFMKACAGALILQTDPSDAGYFYLNEWTSLQPSKNDPRRLILRVGIEEPTDFRMELEAVVGKLTPRAIPAIPLDSVAALAASL